MTHYPGPYAPPPSPMNYPYYAAPDLLAPARRASWLMFALSAFLLLGGFFMGFAGAMFDQIPAEQREEVEKAMTAQGLSFKTQAFASAALMGTPGIALLVLAFFVRRGGFGAAVSAIVVNALLLLMTGLNLLQSALGAARGNPQAGMAACVLVVFAAALVLLMVFLAQAMKASSQVAAMRSQFQQPMWPYPGQPPMYPHGVYPPPPPPSPQDQRMPPDDRSV